MSLRGTVEAVKSLLVRDSNGVLSDKKIARAEAKFFSVKAPVTIHFTEEQRAAREEMAQAFRDAGLVCPGY